MVSFFIVMLQQVPQKISQYFGHPEILESAYQELEYVEEFVKRLVWTTSASEFEDAFNGLEDPEDEESKGDGIQLSTELKDMEEDGLEDPEDEESNEGIQLSPELMGMKEAIHSLTKQVKMIEDKVKEYAEELYYSLPEEEEEDEAVSSRMSFGGHNSKMVGLSDLYNHLKNHLISTDECASFEVFQIVGMPGIGKTTLAKEVFEDPDTVEHFDCRVWVTVGRKCQLKEIQRVILAKLNPDRSNEMLAELGDEEIVCYVAESLKGKRYLIVLDDVWDKYMRYRFKLPDEIEYNAFQSPLPDEGNGSRVLLTTRLQQTNGTENELCSDGLTMRLLNKEESWDLLCDKVFGDESCPPQLERAGKKIAENCDGLPLVIVTVANLLSKAEKTPEYWGEVAVQKNHQLFMAAYDEISKVLLPSYKLLPPLLQMCFLYMGVFPRNYEIPRSKLINMWNVDGFLKPKAHRFLYPSAMDCLEELCYNSLVMIYLRTINEEIKTCGLHSSLWHLANSIAGKTKFSLVLNSRNDGLREDIKSQHRLSFHNNILFAIKDVYKSVEDHCASTTRSLLFYGPYHQYQIPICFSLGLLEHLDALTIRFYEFPVEVIQLVQLKYLALTLNGNVPASISHLSNLLFLIVGRHLSIKSCRHPSNLPVEIWSMKKLQHLQVMGSDLPDPCGASLERLLTLSNVSAHSFTRGVLKAIPKLEKLGIQIELGPDDNGKSLSCFDHISHLQQLNSLKCVIVNPKVVLNPAPFSILPSSLIKLSLNGLGYPWKEMSKIALLPNLQVLKLRNYAFRGPEWMVEEKGFHELRTLVIEDTDLAEWKIGHESFPCLGCLSIKHCYKLEKIEAVSEMFLAMIEVVDCNPLGVEQMKKAMKTGTEVGVYSSLDAGKLKR